METPHPTQFCSPHLVGGFPSSKPTAWDGDFISLITFLTAQIEARAVKITVAPWKVPSPPCGMVIRSFRLQPQPFYMVGSEPTVWDGDRQIATSNVVQPLSCSKPTVWDGDASSFLNSSAHSPSCSEPTGWDGDLDGYGLPNFSNIIFVPSPLCGMETCRAASEEGMVQVYSSKPTVWDGDANQ